MRLLSALLRFLMKFRVVALITFAMGVLQLGFLMSSMDAARAIKQGDRAAQAVIVDASSSLALVDSINHLRSVRSVLAVAMAASTAGESSLVQTQLRKAELKYQLATDAFVTYRQASDKTRAEQDMQAALQASFSHYTQQAIRPLLGAAQHHDWSAYSQLLAGPAAADDEAYERVLDQTLALRKQAAARLIQQTHAQAVAAFRLQTFAAVILLLIAIGLRWVLIRTVARPLQQAQQLAGEVADGHLGHRIEWQTESKHEVNAVLQALAAMDQRLVGVVRQVRDSSEAISAASAQIRAGNEDLSERTQAQAARLEETAATMEQMTASVHEHAQRSRQANALMLESRTLAEQGDHSAQEVMVAIKALAESSVRIADIIGLMDEIAFQTHILALNAAVEAARAGEHGRSFAVVAAEVRALAGRSAEASRQVRDLITEGRQHSAACEHLTKANRDGLSMISESVGRMTTLFAELATASEQQSASLQQVNQSVLKMDADTQQNASLVEEASAAAGSMHQQARDLVRQVAFFKLEQNLS